MKTEEKVKLIRGLLDYRRLETVRAIYERVSVEEGGDGRIRSQMNPAGTETGRFSHGETFLENSTNLGNLPKKIAAYDPLFDVRSVIVPDTGRLLGEADLSQAEARTAAWMAGDKLAIEQYTLGVDRYKFFAAHLYGVDAEEVTKTQRHIAKTVVLALQYGVSWKKLMNTVNKDADLTGGTLNAALAKKAVELYHHLYPRYATWWEKVYKEVEEKGFLRNVFGRRRDFFARRDSDEAREALKREAVAFLPQSTIADLLNIGLGEIYRRYDPWLLKVLLQVHDAVVFDCKVQDKMRAGRLVKAILERPMVINGMELIVPAEVSFSKEGGSWSEMEKVL